MNFLSLNSLRRGFVTEALLMSPQYQSPVLYVSIYVSCSLCHDITDVPVLLVSVSVPPLIAPAGHGLTLPRVTALSRQ